MNSHSSFGAIAGAGRRARTGLAQLRREVLQRRVRRAHFDPAIADGAPWAMLLELYLAFGAQRALRTMDLFHAAGVPDATGSRCLLRLQRSGLVAREDMPGDRRVSLVKLTPVGARKIEHYAAALLDQELD